jgi:glycosyltransferase involved in cell wall biosynthesis
VDDGSTDGTTESIRTIQDERIACIEIDHSGVSRARNMGVLSSNGDYIAFLDSDDEWHREKLQQQVTFHRKNPELLISQTQEIWIRNGKRVNPGFKHLKTGGYIFPGNLNLCAITPSSVFLTRKLFESSGGFDEDLPACEDYDLWLNITANNEVGLIDTHLLTKYGGHADQLSQKLPAMDRFRVYSLGKILLSGKLSKLQFQQAKTVFDQKLAILLQGAEKRSKDSIVLIRFLTNLFELEYSRDRFIELGKKYLLSRSFFG